MSPYQMLKQAADVLDRTAEQLEAAHTKVAEAETKAEQAKVAAEAAKTETKTASAEDAKQEARIGELAKTASDKLLDVGLLSDRQQADIFASQIRDPEVAIQKIAQLSQHVSVAKLGGVVEDSAQPDTESADSVWARRVSDINHKLNLG